MGCDGNEGIVQKPLDINLSGFDRMHTLHKNNGDERNASAATAPDHNA